MPPSAQLKWRSDVNWDEELQGYRVRVLVQQDDNGNWEAHPRDLLGVESGFGATEKEAMNVVKENLANKLTELHGSKIPWVEITGYQRFGARVVKCLIKPKVKNVA